jgi:polysaccharide deacetylase family protein (PEP-CTERM system associated)
MINYDIKHKLHGGMGIDLEDYYHVSAFENILSNTQKQNLPSLVVDSTHILLDILEKYHIQATFFCLGSVAKMHPDLIKKISASGHEIAAHSMHHKRVRDMNAHDFLSDCRQIKNLLSDLTGQNITGYRAPSFSIGADTPFFYDALIETGYEYSSSLNPIKHDHYGDDTAPQYAFHPVENHLFMEIPVTTTTISNRRFALGGGGWFRLMPYFIFKYFAKRINQDGHHLIFYTHPWEFYPEQPTIDGLDFKTKFRHYVNLKKMPAKFDRLCGDFSWGRMDALREHFLKNPDI